MFLLFWCVPDGHISATPCLAVFRAAAAMAETLLFSYGGNSPHAAGARLKSETRCLETTHWACLKSEL